MKIQKIDNKVLWSLVVFLGIIVVGLFIFNQVQEGLETKIQPFESSSPFETSSPFESSSPFETSSPFINTTTRPFINTTTRPVSKPRKLQLYTRKYTGNTYVKIPAYQIIQTYDPNSPFMYGKQPIEDTKGNKWVMAGRIIRPNTSGSDNRILVSRKVIVNKKPNQEFAELNYNKRGKFILIENSKRMRDTYTIPGPVRQSRAFGPTAPRPTAELLLSAPRRK